MMSLTFGLFTQVSVYVLNVSTEFLVWLFWKKTSRYCHSPIVVVGIVVVQKLTFSNIFVITEDIYLKLRLVVYYQKGNT